MKLLSCLLLTLSLVASARADFIDPFNGTTLNISNWTASGFGSDSSVAVSNGNLVLTNRGRVLTNAGFSGTVDLTMAFAFTGSAFDSFKIALRTDGTSTNPSGEFDSGVFATFRIQSDTGETAGNVGLANYDYPSGGILNTGTFALALNQTLLIRLTDDGTTTNLFINDLSTPFLTAASSGVYGNQIGFYNREGAGAGSYISAGSQVSVDFFEVSSRQNVPEGGVGLATFGSVVVGLVALRRRFT